MIRETLVFLGLAAASSAALGVGCVDIADPGERLACYDEAQRCGAIRGDDKRLQCFDREMRIERSRASGPTGSSERGSASNASSAGQNASQAPQEREAVPRAAATYRNPPAPPSAPVPESTSGDTFGRPTEAEADAIRSRIVEVQQDGLKVDYFRLENGQVWRESRDYKVEIAVGQMVEIERATLGSYNLKSDTISKLVKVRRVD